jgi:hypothetical protein
MIPDPAKFSKLANVLVERTVDIVQASLPALGQLSTPITIFVDCIVTIILTTSHATTIPLPHTYPTLTLSEQQNLLYCYNHLY